MAKGTLRVTVLRWDMSSVAQTSAAPSFSASKLQ